MAGRRRPRPESDISDDEIKVNFNKRRKTSESTEEIEKRLESLICRVGEKSSSSLESNLEGLAGVLETDLPNFKSQILHILVLCAYQLPEKCSIYTTLLGLLNVRNYTCGAEFVEMGLIAMKKLIVSNEYDSARYIVQFLGDLVNCNVVTPGSMINLLDTLIQVTKEQDVPQCRKDWYVYAVMACLPWCGGILAEKKDKELDELFAKLHRYIYNRKKEHHPFLRVWTTDDPHPQEEYIDCLFAQIYKLKEDGWIEDIILRPYKAFQPILAGALQHNLPDFISPPHIEGQSKYPLPRVVFRMFDYTDCPEGPVIPGSHAIERWIIEEHLSCLIKTFGKDKKECATRLLAVPGKEKMPLNHMIVETLLGDMLRLPTSPNPNVFYIAVFIELCKLQPSMMPQVLALASDMLYERLDAMNITCVDRFVNWFSHHLSNFQFRWSWDDWADCLSVDPASTKPKFIKEVLEKCVRLAYHQRICDMMPMQFESLFPPPNKINFKYAIVPGADSPEEHKMDVMFAEKVIAAVKSKSSDDELIVLLSTMKAVNSKDDALMALKRLDIFLQSILFLAQKSFSHSFSALSKFHKVLKWAAEEEEGKIACLQILRSVWKDHPQMIVVLVDKMLRMQIVDCSSVAKWIFSPEMAGDFTRMYTWEIMHSTIRKMNKHIFRLEGELAEILERADVASEKKDDDEDENRAFNLFAPNEDDIKKMREQVDAATGEQKKLFLIIFQRFIMILSDHLARSESSGQNYNTPWFRNAIQRLQETFLLHKDTVTKYMATMENLLFTSDLDLHILSVFQQFASIAK